MNPLGGNPRPSRAGRKSAREVESLIPSGQGRSQAIMGIKLPSLTQLRLSILVVRVSNFWLYYRNSYLAVRKSNHVFGYLTDFEPIGSKLEQLG